jgi:hypothetical protein
LDTTVDGYVEKGEVADIFWRRWRWQQKDALGLDDLHILVDKGYFSGREILARHDVSISTQY